MDQALERQVLSCRTLPTLPVVALELLSLSRSESVDLGQMAASLSRDPVLSSRVVQAANAAAFGWGEVASVVRAVTLLGANRVLCVTLTFSLVSMRRQGESQGFDHGAFWRRALYSAIGARALSERLTLEPDEVFLGGLVQDIGALALAEALGARYGQIWQAARGDHARLAELEVERLGASHAEVSHLLASRWSFPLRLQQAALKSHRPPPAPPAALGLDECVYLSGFLADVWTLSSPADAVAASLGAARSLGIDRDSLSSVLARVGALIPEVAAELQVKLASEERRKEVLAEARAALAAVRRRPGAELPPGLEPPPGEGGEEG
jgi:HD-like signal output (HDOD) protein